LPFQHNYKLSLKKPIKIKIFYHLTPQKYVQANIKQMAEAWNDHLEQIN